MDCTSEVAADEPGRHAPLLLRDAELRARFAAKENISAIATAMATKPNIVRSRAIRIGIGFSGCPRNISSIV